MPQSQSQDLMTQFASKLVEEAGFGQLDPQYKEQYIREVAQEAQTKLGLMALSELSKEGMEKFSKLSQKDPASEEVFSFFRNNIKDFDAKVQKTLAEFGEDFIRRAKMLKQNS